MDDVILRRLPEYLTANDVAVRLATSSFSNSVLRAVKTGCPILAFWAKADMEVASVGAIDRAASRLPAGKARASQDPNSLVPMVTRLACPPH